MLSRKSMYPCSSLSCIRVKLPYNNGLFASPFLRPKSSLKQPLNSRLQWPLSLRCIFTINPI